MAKIDTAEDLNSKRGRNNYLGHKASGRSKEKFNEALLTQATHNAKGYKQAVLIVSSHGKSSSQSSAYVDYMSQEDTVSVMDKEENKIELSDAKNKIKDWIKDTKTRKNSTRYTMHLILSGAKKLSREKMNKITSNFLQKTFYKNEAMFSVHTDKETTHSHVSVKMLDNEGKKLRENGVIINEWRNDYAKVMRVNGLKVTATSRASRGLFGKSLSMGSKIRFNISNKNLAPSYERKYDRENINEWTHAYNEIGKQLAKSNNQNIAQSGQEIINFSSQIEKKIENQKKLQDLKKQQEI